MTNEIVRVAVTRRALTTVVCLVFVLAGLLLVASGDARADTTPPAGTPPTVSADALPTWQINGVVWSQVVVNNVVYATGNFTKARPPGVLPGGPGEVSAQNIFAYDLTTGNRVSSFNHSLNAQGRVITASPMGSRIYVGGDFTSVDGASRGHLASFVTSTGQLDASFRPSVNGTVRALGSTSAQLYVGGTYTAVNGAARKSLSAVDALSGALRTWAPKADNGAVWSMVVAPGASRVIVGGTFTTLSGKPAYGMGSLNATSGGIEAWAANQTIRNATSSGAITTLRTDGVKIYGAGYAFGSGSNFEGTFAADPLTGNLTLVNDCHGDTYDVLPVGQVLYSVSHAHDCKWIRSFPDTSPRVRWQRALAQTTAPKTTNIGPDNYGWNYNGRPASSVLQWFPDLQAGTFTGQTQAAWSLAGTTNYVALGGEFTKVNGQAQQGLTRMAVKTLATNKRGPTFGTKPPRDVPATTAAKSATGLVTVTFATAWDQDNASLTYELLRNGVAVKSSAFSTNFWTVPNKTLTDSGLTSGTTYTYQVRIKDPLGNTLLSTKSNIITG